MRPSRRLSGAEETRTGAPVIGFGGARGSGRPIGARAAASRFSLDVGSTRVSATIVSLGIESFLESPPLIIRSSILILADVIEPEPSPFGEIFGAAENWAGREPWGTTGMVLIGFSPTTAALMLETGAPSISRAGVDDLPLAAADLDGGKNNLGCGFAGSEPCPGRPASNFGFGTGEANAGASDSAGEGPV